MKVCIILSTAYSWILFPYKEQTSSTEPLKEKKRSKLLRHLNLRFLAWLVMESTSLPATFPFQIWKLEIGFVFQEWVHTQSEARAPSTEWDALKLYLPGRLVSKNAKICLKHHLLLNSLLRLQIDYLINFIFKYSFLWYLPRLRHAWACPFLNFLKLMIFYL